tara:strand:- start:823 stop:1425 length:603 start_codon:yes stop_codon:yes gene_type:complete
MSSITPILNHLEKHFNNNKINVIEIGARYGDSSIDIIKKLNVDIYTIIDPYKSYDDYTTDGFNKILKNKEDEIFENTKTKLTNLHSNIVFFRTFSNDSDTITCIEDESIDLIFIDGNHEYEYVLQDLKNYYPKLKTNGILCGDDFFMRCHENDILNTMPGTEGYDKPMVYEAVLEFCKLYNKSYSDFGIHRGYGKTFCIT